MSPADLPSDPPNAALDDWVEGATAAVAELGRVFDLRAQRVILDQPELALGEIEVWVRDGAVGALDASGRLWLASHLMAYLAHLLIHLHGGRWLVDRTPGSTSEGRFVVGDFPASPGRVLDPGAAVLPLLDAAEPSIVAVLDQSEHSLGLR